MTAPPYMKLFWGDYHKRTRHLKRDQHGAYFLLIGEAWQLGGALPDDDVKLAAWALCTPEEWAAIKPVVMEFFALRRGKWWHDRVREELASYEATSRKRKAAGKKGGKASGGTAKENPEANAYLLPTKPEPEPEPEPEKRQDADASFVAGGDAAKAFQEWNDLARRLALPTAKDLTPARRKAINARLATAGLDGWREALAAVEASPHCRGENDRGWRADLDFVANAAKFQKLREGSYGPPPVASGGQTAPATFNAPAVRASIVKAQDEDFARRWIDHYCHWEPDGRRLIARTSSVASRLQRDLAEWASANRVTIEVATANDEASPLPHPKDQAA